MDRVEEIETAIDRLPPEDYRRIVDWLRAREQGQWDEQIDRDSSAGKLDFLFNVLNRISWGSPVLLLADNRVVYLISHVSD
jgi:hypothetical protein